jgi:hypothetical protein
MPEGIQATVTGLQPSDLFISILGKSTILSEQFPLCGFRKMILYVVANWQNANVSDRLVFGTMFGSTTHWHNVEDQPSQSMIALITRILDLRSP